MCNVLHFSTTSGEDFTALNGEGFAIFAPAQAENAKHLRFLAYPNKWNFVSRYGCGCHFLHYGRYILDDETGALIGCGDAMFATPAQDTLTTNDDQEIDDTAAMYDLFVRILAEGHKLDVLDSWNGDDLHRVRSLDVSLSQVPRDAFRFFETCRFALSP